MIKSAIIRPKPDISGAIPESPPSEKVALSDGLQTLFNRQWPRPKSEPESLEQTESLLKKLTGAAELRKFNISESGRELTFQDEKRKSQTLRIDNFAPKEGKPILSCFCYSNKEVPILRSEAWADKEVFFDDKFEIPCKGKRNPASSASDGLSNPSSHK